MKVVVERVSERGKVIAALWSRSPREVLVWESSANIYSNYDPDGDVLYVSKGASVDEYTDGEDEMGVWHRRSEDDDTPTGVTVFGVRKWRTKDAAPLIQHIAEYLSIAPGDVDFRVKNALERAAHIS
jgi:hypothetical protein